MLEGIKNIDVAQLAPLYDDLYMLVPIYALGVPLLRAHYKGVPFNAGLWKPIMVVYNAIMTIFSAACAVGMAYIVWGKFGGNIKRNECDAFAKDELYDWIVWAFYMSKYIEFADTFFLIIKGKGVSWLHYYHHIGAAIDMGILWKSGAEATWIFVLFNGTVHTVMYAYYGAALVGYRLKGKSMITVMQIAQFIVGMGTFYTYADVPCFASSSQLMFVYYFTNAYVFGVLCFFLNFFLQNYIKKAPAKTGAAPATKKVD
ncbi:Elongation of very long chain fatty acids protein 5 [Hondaea fermentalgiana]|uniref:Elongation of fatty acids protein n=1 Tax=Hondaea fermentalgiana TaxID=2315210 RepID=A0A2R5G2S5_9STRA|nr:Elongation of very long chain fatty acids protein 5 [Hondaea fermentalgiana]|eukprot:GBG25302.1 Elongation of very long chain fatty acids protein 5 [Hondaea fermentalgiana]